MICYMVRKIRTPGGYQVSKFNGKAFPDDVYTVIVQRPPLFQSTYLHCSCMGFGRIHASKASHHKHIKLVEAFIDAGEPQLSVWKLDARDNPQLVEDRH